MSAGSGAGTRTAGWPPAARVPGEAPGAAPEAGQPPPVPGKSKAKRQPLHGKPRFGSVTLLTFFLVLLMLIPSNLVFAPMGGVGTPANMAALLILLWYVLSWITGRIVPTGAGRPVRIAMFIFALAVVASFVAAMTRSIVESEILAADRGLVLIVAFAALIVVPSQTINSYERLDTLLRRAVILGAEIGRAHV